MKKDSLKYALIALFFLGFLTLILLQLTAH